MQSNTPQPERLLRVRGVLARVPVSKTTWWNWVRDGYAPKPLRIGENVTCWTESSIDDFIARMRDKQAVA